METPQEFGGRFSKVSELIKRPSCIVYKGTDKTLNRDVAIKVFVDRPDGNASFIKSFEEEVTLLRSASHASLVPIIAGGESEGWFYIAMELISGPTLRDMLKAKGGPLETEKALDLFTTLAEAVGEIHEKKGLHGHIDTRGILMKNETPCLAGYYPKTIDQISKSMTMTDGRMTIDPIYIAPEQIEKPETTDGRADIYSLCVILFEMLTGSRPFSSNNPLQTAMMRLSTKPPSATKMNSAISPLLDAAIIKGLSKDPNQRFKTVAELIDAISSGRKKNVNPLAESAASGGAERISSSETIAVSMSADAIKQMLKAHEAKAAPQAAEVTGTLQGMRAQGGGGPVDMSATMAGVSVSTILKPSFIIVEGPRRGERFLLEKDRVMVGSDPSCEISLSGKGIPRRYAFIMQKDGGTFAESLSGEALTINGHSTDPEESSVKLKRGDILQIGEFQLRFVAPGEVFTLQGDVADRIIDRPKSKAPKIIVTTLIAIATLCAGGFYFYDRHQDDLKAQRASADRARAQKQDALIQQLRQQGDEFFKAGAFVEPVGANAKERFQQVLNVNPDDSYAKRRLAEIDVRLKKIFEEQGLKAQYAQEIEKLMADAERYFQRGELIAPPGRNARDAYREVLRKDSTNEIALKRISEIEKMIGDVMGRVSGLLAKSKEQMDAGNYVFPRGESAYDMVKEVLKVDPNNTEARNQLYDMAARSIFEGDQAKASLDPKTMKQKFLTAQALGVDPEFVNEKLRGIEIMQRAKSSVVITTDSMSDYKCKPQADSKFLNCEEIIRRVAELSLKSKSDEAGQSNTTSEKTFRQIKGGKK